MKREERKYLPNLTELFDRLTIVTLKSIKLGCNDVEKKEVYEAEADLIMHDINIILQKDKNLIKEWGKFMRGAFFVSLSNEVIWQNETLARQAKDKQNHLLPFTHSVNSVRMHGGNMMANQLGYGKDFNSDRLNNEICIDRGYNFSGCFR